MKKKYLLFIFCAVLISFISVGITTAYLTSMKTEANVFTIGKVVITLDEAEVDELGNKISDNRVNENKYHLMPGYTYLKDPTVTVKNGSNDAYVRILITINNIVELKAIYGEDFTPNNIYSNWGKNWIYFDKKENEDKSITYEYRYKEVVSGINDEKKLEPLFNEFTIPGETKQSELESLEELNVKIIAQAIQKSGFENERDAWNSFAIQYNE